MARVKNTARHGCVKCKRGIARDLAQCSLCKKTWHTNCADPTLRALDICEKCELSDDEIETANSDLNTENNSMSVNQHDQDNSSSPVSSLVIDER